MLISNRIKNTKISAIRKLTPFAKEAKQKGLKVYHMNIGQPDVATPKEYFEGLKSYDKKVLGYESSEGIDELRSAFSDFLKKNNIYYSPEEIYITNGGSEALLFSFLIMCDEGDEILVPEPYYSNYNTIASSCGVKLVPFKTSIYDGFHIKNKESIELGVTAKTRAILYSNPSNPTGVVYSINELQMIADVAYEKELYIISDEVYRELVYDGIKYESIFSIEKIRENLVLVDSLSKRYSVCGSRVGMIATKNKNLREEIVKLCQSRLSTSSVEQYTALSLLKIPMSYIESVRDLYQERRNEVCRILEKIEGVKIYKPEGAFYLIASLPVDDAEDFCKWLLTDFSINNETVMFAPAEGFYIDRELGKSQIRLSYCISVEDLEKALHILEEGLKVYNSKN